tara:strand:- start:119 stop:1051 length:933 start_codon:yes stop_codon:yes gene_type:complete
MNKKDISRVDLNSLVVLHALLEERHVGRVAIRFNVTQSAVSHTLKRLRVLFDDELFIRTPSEMRPTERVDELAVELGDILASIERIIYPEITFDPRSFEGEVIIGTSDYGSMVLLPHIIACFERLAPKIRLFIKCHNIDHDVAQLDSEEVDFCITPLRASIPKRIKVAPLFDDDFVMVFDHNNPLFQQPLSMDRLKLIPRIVATSRDDRISLSEPYLMKMGFSIEPKITVQHFLSVPYLLQRSEYIALLPSLLLKNFDFLDYLPLDKTELLIPPIRMGLFYNEQRVQSSDSLTWVANMIKKVADELNQTI